MSALRRPLWLERFEELSRPWRVALLIGAHLGIFFAAYFSAFILRFDFHIPLEFHTPMLQGLLAVLIIKTLVFALLQMFRGWWRYVSLYDVIALAQALAVSSLLLFATITFAIRPTLFPRSIYFLDFAFSLLFLGGARGLLRLVKEALNTTTRSDQRRLLIVGAGDVGDSLVRAINRAQNLPYLPVAFLDSAAHKRGLHLHGIPVLGPFERLQDVVHDLQIEEIIIALDPGQSDDLRHIVELAMPTRITPRILPAVQTVLDGELSLHKIRDISISDLLHRDPIHLDEAQLADFIKDRTVMVTGAGGSIGSELCRQILRLNPHKLLMVDAAETPLFSIHRELRPQHDHKLLPFIANVADPSRMELIFQEHRPDVVLHAAAYKHVPLMEQHPAEAVRNNIQGSRIITDLAGQYEVQTFVLISTDKAVNPTSVMGATKRITELYMHSVRHRFPHTRFCAVRFGNVLGSNGSVVPIFRDQIRRGGPITVTHPDMTRYFMTIPEATQLVLQAAAFHSDHSLFILDMGQPVKIADLARDMIRLSGLTEDQIPIVFTGPRPGEKLFEELSLEAEDLKKTEHAKIFVAQPPRELPEHFDPLFRALLDAGRAHDEHRVRFLLTQLIPGYKPPLHHPDTSPPPDLRATP